MKKVLIFLALTMVSITANAICTGVGSFSTCTDNYGNHYTVNRIGNMTTVQGNNYQTGSGWNESSTRLGNSTTINGTASNGNHWNETITNMGTYRMIQGTDSNGNYYSKMCNQYGCN